MDYFRWRRLSNDETVCYWKKCDEDGTVFPSLRELLSSWTPHRPDKLGYVPEKWLANELTIAGLDTAADYAAEHLGDEFKHWLAKARKDRNAR